MRKPPILLVLLVACEMPVASVRLSVIDGPVAFETERDISEGAVRGVTAMDAADVDGDGLLDVAVFEGGKHAGGRVTFAWYASPDAPGSGDWTRHDLNRPSPMRPFIGAARFSDVDEDGDPDLVVSMDHHSGDTRSAYVYWLENPRPHGSPADDEWVVREVAGDLAVHHINDLEVADMDGDGRLDVIARALSPNELHLWFQDGPASWAGRTLDASPYGASGEGFALGNVDGAGQLDITICGHWLHAPPNPRSDDYEPHSIDAEYHTINWNTKEATGDIDGDGRLDVIISPAEGYRGGNNHVLAWYRGPERPTTATAWTRTVIASDFNGGHTVRLADMDADGDLDVVSGVAWNRWGQTRSVKTYYNLGSGSFGNVQTVVTGKGLYSGVVADLGDDGDLDIIGQDGYSDGSHPYIYESTEGRTPPTMEDAGATGAMGDAGTGGDGSGTPADGGVVVEGDASTDARVPDEPDPGSPSADPLGDAPSPEEPGRGGGCAAAGGSRSWPTWPLLAAALFAIIRRKSHRGR